MSNLNRWLCMHFDETDKGYVTVGDILAVVFSDDMQILYLIIGLITILSHLIGTVILFSSHDVLPTNTPNIFYSIICGYAVFLVLGIIVIIFNKIIRLKIARCELKQNGEK